MVGSILELPLSLLKTSIFAQIIFRKAGMILGMVRWHSLKVFHVLADLTD